MTFSFDLTNGVSARKSLTNIRSYGQSVQADSYQVTYSADNDDTDAAIIAAGIVRIGNRPLRSLQRLDAFLDELEAEDPGS